MQGQGFKLNPFEQSTLALLAEALSKPGTASLIPMGMGILEGAQQRRATNIDERQAGVSSLQQVAAQMASQGASQDAISGLITGQAQGLPGMGGPRGEERLGGLEEFVGSLYGEGPVSGLAPADYRAQFATAPGLLDDEDRQIIGSTVAAGLSEGRPFMDLRQEIMRTMTAAGGDAQTTAAAVSEAERMYEQMIGMPLEEMRGIGDQLRQTQTAGNLGDLFSDYADQGLPSPYPDAAPEDIDITALVGQLANSPGTLEQLAGWLGESGGDYTQQQPNWFSRNIVPENIGFHPSALWGGPMQLFEGR